MQLVGFTSYEIRKIAFDLAVKLEIKHNFNMKNQVAGKDWLRGFMQRHPQLALRKPEHTSVARALGFNKQAVTKFFDILEDVLNKNSIIGANIYNVDETPVSNVPKGTAKIIASKGQRQVGGLVAGERGEHVTAEICFSATGNYMPPMIIFPRKNSNEVYFKGAPAGAMVEFHPSGYMQSDLFLKWMEKFIEFSKPSENNKVLLLLDGHSTHVKNLAAINLAKNNNVIIICLPPHCTHKLQPVDLSFNKPLSTYFAQECNAWTRRHKKDGKYLNLKNLFEVFTPAYELAASVQTAINGFRKAGIHPFNRDIFQDTDFATTELSTQNGLSITEFDQSLNEIIQSAEVTTPTETPASNSNNLDCELNANEFGNSTSIDHEMILDVIDDTTENFEVLHQEPGYEFIDSIPETTDAITTQQFIPNPDMQISSTPSASYSREAVSPTVSTLAASNLVSAETTPSSLMPYSGVAANTPNKKIAKKRSQRGRTAVLTDENFVEELTILKKNTAKKNTTKKKPAEKKNKKIADITNNNTTAVQVQFCAPFYPYNFQPQVFSPPPAFPILPLLNQGSAAVLPSYMMQANHQSNILSQTQLWPSNLPAVAASTSKPSTPGPKNFAPMVTVLDFKK